MNSVKPPLLSVSEEDRTPLVDNLLEYIKWQSDCIEQLEDEMQKLKKETRKPKFKTSKMDSKTEPKGKKAKKKKKGPKCKKKQNLIIHEAKVIELDTIPHGARSKGYQDIVVQDIVIQAHNTRYRLARYQTEDGKYITAKLPKGIRNHWGSTLQSFILYQYHHQHVTQPLLLEQLHAFKIDISSGQLS